MSVFRIIDGKIISEAEYRDKRNDLMKFLEARAAGRARSAFVLSSGRTLAAGPPSSEAAVEPFLDRKSAGFTEIGKGLPLTIFIRHVYTGEYPQRGLFGGDGDVALVSGVKSYEVFTASTRALNFLVKNVNSFAHLDRPSAFRDGTSVVFYSPAVMTDSLTISLELAVATFPLEFVNSLTTAFDKLAGIPMLLPYAGYVLGAGQLLKLVGNIGHGLFDGIKFSVTDSIDLDMPGTPPAAAGFRIIAPYDFSGFTYSPGKGVLDKQGKEYDGPSPYIVLSLDGKPNDNLKDFAPTAASAAVLQRFFEVQDGGQVAIDTFVQGLQLVSDIKYRKRAIELRNRLAESGLDQPTEERLQKELKATLENIREEAFKPKWPGSVSAMTQARAAIGTAAAGESGGAGVDDLDPAFPAAGEINDIAPQVPQPLAPSFTVRQGRRYRATVVLSGFEQFAGNDLIEGKLTQVGFTEVVVTGSGGLRHAEGTWKGQDRTAQLDPHLTHIVELPTAATAVLGGAAMSAPATRARLGPKSPPRRR